MKRYIILLLAIFMGAGPVYAQSIRAGNSFYITTRSGVSYLNNELSTHGVAPWIFSLEGGYRFAPHLSVGLAWRVANYPDIVQAGPTKRNTFTLRLKNTFSPRSRFTPYFQTGIHSTSAGKFSFTDTGYGIVGGLGFDLLLRDKITLFAEAEVDLVFPDPVLDNLDGGDFQDLIGFAGIGLRYIFNSAFKPITNLVLSGPDELLMDERGNFEARTNEATRNVVLDWDFGDGKSATGENVTHLYESSGTYTVEVRAHNEWSGHFSEQRKSFEVVVFTPVEILAVAVPAEENINTEIRFETEVNQATTPIEYTWDFGDGNRSSGERPTHKYEQDGQYWVTVTAKNSGSTTQQRRQIRVIDPCPKPVILSAVTVSENGVLQGEEIQFNVENSGGEAESWLWSFDDGTTSSEQNPHHVFSSAGKYTVTVKAADCSGIATQTISVLIGAPLAEVISCSTVTFADIYFAYGSDKLTETAKHKLSQNLVALNSCSAGGITIKGWADPTGSEIYNKELSVRRAEAVKLYYQSIGVASVTITTVGMGEIEGDSESRRAETTATD